ncbi:MAG: DUF1800 family protein [Planctomycetota bacterium]
MLPRCRPTSVLAPCFFISVFLAQTVLAGTFEVATRQEMTDLMVRLRAMQFLQRATFGPTDAEVNALADQMKQVGVIRACSNWIDNQFSLPPTLHEDRAMQMLTADGWGPIESGVNLARYRDHAFWDVVCRAPDQLRQRIAWALIQIVVTSRDGSNFNNVNFSDQTNQLRPFWLGPTNYYDMLVENADDTYREILSDVTRHPVMGVYLSHVRNQKANLSANTFPDENYAREIMQLFSIGLYRLAPDGEYLLQDGERIPTYDNETIKEMARVFTGLTYAGHNPNGYGRPDLHRPMPMYANWHDFGEKTLIDGETLPARNDNDGLQDIEDALDILYEHYNVAPFISRLLIQRLVRSNPSRGYLGRVSRVFNNNGQGVKGDMKAVVKAILLDREAWDSIRTRRLRRPTRIRVTGSGSERVRLVEPVVKYAGWLRRFVDDEKYNNGEMRVSALNGEWVQAPYRSPSVFNFYLPNYQPAGPLTTYTASRRIPNREIFAPEFQVYTSVVQNKMANRYRSEVYNKESRHVPINNTKTGRVEVYLSLNFDKYEAIVADTANPDRHADLVAALDLDLCGGTMSDRARQSLVDAIDADSVNPNSGNYVNDVTRAAVASVVTSPAALIVE